jgi:hypothetical protein
MQLRLKEQTQVMKRDVDVLLSVRGSGGGLSRGRGVVLLPLGGGGLLLVDGEVRGAARHDR